MVGRKSAEMTGRYKFVCWDTTGVTPELFGWLFNLENIEDGLFAKECCGQSLPLRLPCQLLIPDGLLRFGATYSPGSFGGIWGHLRAPGVLG